MIIVNTVDCKANKRGVGVEACIQELGQPNGFMEVDLTWSTTLAAGTLNLAFFQLEMQKENFVIFNNATGFEETTEDTVFETFSSGQKKAVREGLVELKFQYNNGYGWHSAASTHQGFNNKAIVLIWDNGVFGFDESKDGTIRGLRRSYLNVKNFKNNDGAASSNTMIEFQLTESKAYNEKMALVNEDTLDFIINSDLKSPTEYDVNFVEAPADGDNDCKISVLAFVNNGIFAAGLLPTDLKISGKTIATAVADSTNKYYDVTISGTFVATETHTAKINDGTYDVAIVGESLYKGTGKAITVTA